MFRHYFEQMDGIGMYPTISLLVFMLFFLGVFVWTASVRKSHIEHMSNLPLGNDASILASDQIQSIDLSV